MDETVNDFLKEINEIAPATNKKQVSCDWQKCFDENSGFPYYWNIKTDQVTWEMPLEYKDSPDSKSVSRKEGFIRPPIPDDVKIYKISEESMKIINKGPQTKLVAENLIKTKKEASDDKSILISSYGSGTESDEEENLNKLAKSPTLTEYKSVTSTSIIDASKNKDENKTEASELEETVDKVVKSNQVSGFSLVAGYGGESDEEQDESIPTLQTTTHSPLFPIVEPVTIDQFSKPDIVKPSSKSEELETIDLKAFQRKRRIDIPFINPGTKRVKSNEVVAQADAEEKKIECSEASASYPGFRKGGVLFTKAETDEEKVENLKEEPTIVSDKISTENSNDESILKNKETLQEKLTFLNEGKEATSAVQTMLIQMETLFEAFKSGNLVPSYLLKWLDDMSSELIKLEQEATPSGWLLQWDRSQKRYFYCNKETSQTQWHYPELDANNCSDDAMDISTTPPPPEVNDRIEVEPPPPPSLARVVTPPPPIISYNENETEPSQTTAKTDANASSKTKVETDDSIASAINSFYSDIAAIESNVVPEPVNIQEPNADNSQNQTNVTKKKKTKVKLSQGLAMKKKGVSKLVEKWKNLQKNYD